MSEEKRFIKNKKILALSISLVVVCITAGVLGMSLLTIDDKYSDLFALKIYIRCSSIS